MLVLCPGARLDFVHPPTAIREAFESIHSDECTVINERCCKDRRNSRVGNQRFRASDGLIIVVMFDVRNENAARPQLPSLDADFDPNALDGACSRFLCRFRIVDGLPKLLWALTASHVAGL